ncbi:hypothetical protein PSR1_04384 [Anaeromyxobacter sp. PSR-1]|nr:hypothetical protein PSR1_04384 [Anaeromyxobacter sp. PSR-1]
MASVSAAHATRSPRYFGNSTPALGAPTWWPARPMRCIPLATEGGASIWTTRSTEPMSMPSSSEEVATRPRTRPALRLSSMAMRCGRAMEPWCACTSVSPASSLSAPASRSATRRLFTNSKVVRCAFTSSSRRGWMAVQIEARGGACEASPPGRSSGSPRRDMSSTGTSTVSSSGLRDPASTTATGRQAGRAVRSRSSPSAPSASPAPAGAAGRAPPRNRATSSSGRCVAESPMRCSGRPASCSSRSSDSARCAPRFEGTSAWISSTITVSTVRSPSRAACVSSR